MLVLFSLLGGRAFRVEVAPGRNVPSFLVRARHGTSMGVRCGTGWVPEGWV